MSISKFALTNTVGMAVFALSIYSVPAHSSGKWVKATNDTCKIYIKEPDKYTAIYEGKCDSSGSAKGNGTQLYSNGDKYVGRFENGMHDGRGTFTWTNGQYVTGIFWNDLPHGRGTEVFPNGDKYVGEFYAGNHYGHGTYTWANGSQYVGEYKQGKRHGLGKMTLVKGDKGIQGYGDKGIWVGDTYVLQGEFNQGEFVKAVNNDEFEKRNEINNMQSCGVTYTDAKRSVTEESYGTCSKKGTDQFTGLILVKQNGKPIDIVCKSGRAQSYQDVASSIVTFGGFEYDSCWKALHLIPNTESCPIYKHYRGQCNKEGEAHGVGYETGWEGNNREVYRGMFQNNKRHGHGSQVIFTSGDRYSTGSGYYINDKRQYDCTQDLKDCEGVPAKRAKEEQEREKKVANFRKSLQVGDDTSTGIVIEIKGNLVKIQTNDEQCSQRDYDGKCRNWISTPVEKWVKRSELLPAD